MCGSKQGYEMAGRAPQESVSLAHGMWRFWPGGLHDGAQARPSITPQARRSTASRQQKETE